MYYFVNIPFYIVFVRLLNVYSKKYSFILFLNGVFVIVYVCVCV